MAHPPEQPRGPITALKSAVGTTLHMQRDIHNELIRHYTALYQTAVMATEEDINNYLNLVPLPQITREQRDDLDMDIIPQEIREAML
mgnify:CR=1 FL=1